METAPPCLPWSNFHQGIDRQLASQVAGDRDGKRDKPLTRGNLLPLRRISRVYRVEGDNLAFEPAATPPEWFRLSGELPSAPRTIQMSTQDMDSVESSFRRSKAISNFMEWQMALLSSMLASDDDQVELDRVRRVVHSMDRGAAQLAWEVSIGLSNVQLKRRDQLISKLSSTIPEEEKLALRASAFSQPDIFEKPLIRHADVAFQEATQRKATLTMLGSRKDSASMPPPPPWMGQQQKRSSSTGSSSSQKKKPKHGAKAGPKRGGHQAPHTSGPANRGGGRGRGQSK